VANRSMCDLSFFSAFLDLCISREFIIFSMVRGGFNVLISFGGIFFLLNWFFFFQGDFRLLGVGGLGFCCGGLCLWFCVWLRVCFLNC